MKKFLSCVIAGCILLMSLSGMSFAATTYQPTISVEGGNFGETITVTVSIPANDGVAAGSFNLIYDNTKLELVDAKAGAAVPAVTTIVNKTYAANKIRVNFAGTTPISANGGVALEVTFRAIADGTAAFEVEKFKLSDADANYLTCADAQTTANVKVDTTPIPVERVWLDKTSLTLTEGESAMLVATILPSVATDKSVTWKTSDSKVATVANGVVTAKAAGKVTITVTTVDGKKTATCEVTVNASLKPIIVVSDARGVVGRTVDVKVSLKNNPGITAMLLKLHYDSDYLTLTKVTNGGVLKGAIHNGDLTANPYTLYWADDLATSNNTANGTIVTLTFKVSENAPVGFLPITITYDNDYDAIYGIDGLVDFKVTNGAVEVCDFIHGDLDDNGKVNVFDRSDLVRYIAKWPGYTEETINLGAADVNNDGKVNGKDDVIFARYFAGWPGYESLPLMLSGGVSAENTAKIVVSENRVTQGTQTVDVTLSLENNPGFVNMLCSVKFDSEVFTLTKVTDAGVLGGTSHNPSSKSPCTLYWTNGAASSDFTANGRIVTLTFEIAEDAALGRYPITVTLEEDAVINFDLEEVRFTPVNGAVTITKKNMTGLSFEGAEFTYDGTSKSIAVAGNLPKDAEVKYLVGNAAAAVKEVSVIEAGEYNITATVSAPGYNDWEGQATLRINPKPVTVTGLKALDKRYDGTVFAEIDTSAAMLLGKVESDDLSIMEYPITGTFASANAGNNIEVKVAEIELDGADRCNYVLTQPKLYANISKVPITVTGKKYQLKVGRALPNLAEAFEITAGVLVGNDTFTGTVATTAKIDTIGTYKITKGTLALSANYNLTFVDGEIVIVEKTRQKITAAPVDTKTYGDASFLLEVTADETSMLDTFTYASSNEEVVAVSENGTVTIVGAGEATITVKQAGDDEYAPAEVPVKIVVNPFEVVVTDVDMESRTAQLNGVFEKDVAKVQVDFDRLKTTVLSSETRTEGRVTTVTSILKVTNFQLKGEKASNYVIADDTSVETTVVTETINNDPYIELDKTSLSIIVGDSQTLMATVYPETENGGKLYWFSSDPSVATVVDGVITAKKEGEAYIFAIVDNSHYATKCVVTVTPRVTSALTGNANGDEDVDFVDAILVLKHDADIEELTGDNLLAADVIADGDVDFVDAIMILKYDAGIITSFK